MSFLNPVNEPVLRFKSTDASAPQINYNARTAGDVKAVLKTCLVTGYGATASAGWSIANEVNHVAEFVSPSAAMSDYRLGIDDTSTSSTTWYYQYRDARVNPAYNTPSKNISYVDKLHASNGWQLFVTPRGIIFVELFYSTVVNKLSARLTYWGQAKSGLTATTGANMMFFNIGQSATISEPYYLYSANYPHFQLESFSGTRVFAATPFAVDVTDYNLSVSNVDIVSAMYLASTNKDVVLGELPGMVSKVVNNTADMYGISEQTLSTRPVLSVCCGYNDPRVQYMYSRGRTYLIYLDYWEY
ncbi:MAG: hypothetical protein PHG15_03610 [Acinetobacter sp.]|uniref:hypothetical protein n=1 Tax=Acinetobacter sp. TaxID=472 RepID=UPI0026133593|nr:hypothetical protein [Acinetobacter sp.]MDD2944898.1 hypothetical protein [Acinetobacter sp.]